MNVSVSKKETAGLIIKVLIVIVILLLFSIIKSAFSTTYSTIPEALAGKIYYTEAITEIYSFEDNSSGKYSIVDYDKESNYIVATDSYRFSYVINPEDNNVTVTFLRDDNSRTLTFIQQGLIDITNNKYFFELADK